MSEKYIQIGVTALRDPATGDFLPSVPLYIKADEATEEAEQQMFKEAGKSLAGLMKKYIESRQKDRSKSNPDAMNEGS